MALVGGVIEGFVVRDPHVVSAQVEAYGGVVCALPCAGLGLVPVTQPLRLAAHGGPGDGDLVDGFPSLTLGLARLGARLSGQSKVGHVHMEFHGGTGFHAAVGWADGSQAWGPEFTANAPEEPHYRILREPSMRNWAINRLLRWMGVTAREGLDEFAVAGLARHRWTEDWLASPSEFVFPEPWRDLRGRRRTTRASVTR